MITYIPTKPDVIQQTDFEMEEVKMLLDEFRKEVTQAVNDYLKIAYKIPDISMIYSVDDERKRPCIDIIKIVKRDNLSGEQMRGLIRCQLNSLQDTGLLKTGRSRLRALVSNVLDDERFSDYEFLKERCAKLEIENHALRSVVNSGSKRHRMFVEKPKDLTADVKQTVLKYDAFGDGGEFLGNSL